MFRSSTFTLILTITTLAQAKNDSCPTLDVSLTQKIENGGFHREAHWLLEKNTKSCRFMIVFQAKRGFFVNPDQIADLNRFGALAAYVEGAVDVEAPMHFGTPHKVFIFVPNESGDRVSITLPFHLRYQRSKIAGESGKVIVSKPSLLAICRDDCRGEREPVRAFCTMESEKMCEWRNVTYQALFDDVELFIPIGNLDDYPFVAIVTLLLGCVGCIYTLSILSTTSV